MANTRLNQEGDPIGDPNQDLDYIPRRVGKLTTQAEAASSVAAQEKRFKEKFTWIPHSKGEVTLALEGLNSRINRSGRLGLRQVESTLEQVKGYKQEALRDAILLRGAFTTPNELSTLSAGEIVEDKGILRILAKQQLFTDSLGTGKWGQKGTLEKRLNPLILDLYTASDEILLTLWHATFDSATQRGDLWISESNRVAENPWVEQANLEAHHRTVSR
jgi:hypothetical protein